MKASPAFEFPPAQEQALRKARRLEWVTIAYLISVGTVMYLVLGSSQAMKTAWLEDLLSLIPPTVFLLASRIAIWTPNKRFPYGYHRAVSIAFLCASLALFTMGAWLLIEAITKVVMAKHPTIGGIPLFGRVIWLGWLMLPALVWSAVPAMFLGRAKLPLAKDLHDKVLFTDANMNKADWLTASAAFVGVLGVGFGLWWTDAVAAALISLNVLHDGYKNLREVVTNLMDEVPKLVDSSEVDPLPDRVQEYLKQMPWIEDAQVRMREQGHVYFGEAFVVASEEENLAERLYHATQECAALDWRIHDFVIVLVPSLTDAANDSTGE
jgi:cation diffusion facilitator family transporter